MIKKPFILLAFFVITVVLCSFIGYTVGVVRVVYSCAASGKYKLMYNDLDVLCVVKETKNGRINYVSNRQQN